MDITDIKKELTSADWITLQYSFMWVFQNVAGADGTIDKAEQLAMKNITSHASTFESVLIQEVLASLDSHANNIYRQSLSDHRGYKQGLKDAAQIVTKILPYEEALLYKKTLVSLGFYVANVSGDDSSSKVSSEEVNILASLAFHLGLEMEELQKRPTISEIIAHLPRK